MISRLAAALVLVASAISAQPAFEVVSIKTSNAVTAAMDIKGDPGGGIVMTNVNLRTLVMFAYQLQPFQLDGGPSWLRSRRFDVNAKAPAGGRKDQTWDMVKSMLAERFQMVVHRETRQLPMFDLVVAKSGFKLQPAHRASSESDGSVQTWPDRLKGVMIPMSDLAKALAGRVGSHVVDRTQVEGKYDFRLEFAPEGAAPDDARPPLYAALQEQLGLKLESTRGPVEVVVIDRAALPGEN